MSLLRRALSLTAALVAAVAVAAGGAGFVAPGAEAATDTVAVTATVGSSLSVSDTCSGAIGISIVLSSYAAGSCAFEFGSTNDATTTLRISSSAGAFLSGGFADAPATCGALANDTVGIKVTSVGSGVTSSLCTVSAAGTNADLVGIPDAATNACAATTAVTNNTCTLAVGIKETGSDTTAGTYTGTLNLDVLA